MKKTKMDKGITLIALIITIVVLLILAVVAIRAVQDDGIIAHAQNAASEYTIAQEQENLRLAILEWELVNIDGQTALSSFLEEKYGDNIKLKTYEYDLNGEQMIHLAFIDTQEEYVIDSKGEIQHINFDNAMYAYRYTLDDGTYIIRLLSGFPPTLWFAEVKFSLKIDDGNTKTNTTTEVYNVISGEEGNIPAANLGHAYLGTVKIPYSLLESAQKLEAWCEIKSNLTDRVFTTKHIVITDFDAMEEVTTIVEQNKDI